MVGAAATSGLLLFSIGGKAIFEVLLRRENWLYREDTERKGRRPRTVLVFYERVSMRGRHARKDMDYSLRRTKEGKVGFQTE